MKAIAERLKGEIAFRPRGKGTWDAQVDYRPIIAASLPFAGHYLGGKIGFTLFHPHPTCVLWSHNSIADQ
jgi:hypothetical protein